MIEQIYDCRGFTLTVLDFRIDGLGFQYESNETKNWISKSKVSRGDTLYQKS